MGYFVRGHSVADTLGFDAWIKKYYAEDELGVIEVRFKKGRKYGPYYLVHGSPQIDLTPDNLSSVAFGLVKPFSPEDARKMFAIPDGERTEYLSEVYVTPRTDLASGIIGVPKSESGAVAGTAQVIHFNSAALSFLEVKRIPYPCEE